MNRAPRQGQKAFSLLELLVAMTLLSMLVIALITGLRMATRSWETGTVSNHETAQMLIVTALLRHLVASTRAVPTTRASILDATGGAGFEGDSEALRFVSTLPIHAAPSGAYETVLSRRETELVLKRSPLTIESFSDSPVDETVLLDDVVSFEVAYFGQEKHRDEAHWKTHWTTDDPLPQLLRIDIETQRRGQWPSLLVAVPARTVLKPRASFTVLGEAS